MGGLVVGWCCSCVFFFKQKTAYEMRSSDWSSDVCSSDLRAEHVISGAIRIVVSRSFSSSIERVAMMPGTAHAKDDSNGMNARPDSPTAAMKIGRAHV